MDNQITRTYGSDPETDQRLNILATLNKSPKSWVIRWLINREYERHFPVIPQPVSAPSNGGERAQS